MKGYDMTVHQPMQQQLQRIIRAAAAAIGSWIRD
jgi:hypothetical protein